MAGLGSPEVVLPGKIGASKGNKNFSMAPMRKRKTDVEVPPDIQDESPDNKEKFPALMG